MQKFDAKLLYHQIGIGKILMLNPLSLNELGVQLMYLILTALDLPLTYRCKWYLTSFDTVTFIKL